MRIPPAEQMPKTLMEIETSDWYLDEEGYEVKTMAVTRFG